MCCQQRPSNWSVQWCHLSEVVIARSISVMSFVSKLQNSQSKLGLWVNLMSITNCVRCLWSILMYSWKTSVNSYWDLCGTPLHCTLAVHPSARRTFRVTNGLVDEYYLLDSLLFARIHCYRPHQVWAYILSLWRMYMRTMWTYVCTSG